MVGNYKSIVIFVATSGIASTRKTIKIGWLILKKQLIVYNIFLHIM